VVQRRGVLRTAPGAICKRRLVIRWRADVESTRSVVRLNVSGWLSPRASDTARDASQVLRLLYGAVGDERRHRLKIERRPVLVAIPARPGTGEHRRGVDPSSTRRPGGSAADYRQRAEAPASGAHSALETLAAADTSCCKRRLRVGAMMGVSVGVVVTGTCSSATHAPASAPAAPLHSGGRAPTDAGTTCSAEDRTVAPHHHPRELDCTPGPRQEATQNSRARGHDRRAAPVRLPPASDREPRRSIHGLRRRTDQGRGDSCRVTRAPG